MNERRRVSPNDREDNFHPLKRSRNSRYEGNATNQSEYIIISTLSCSLPRDSWDGWLIVGPLTTFLDIRRFSVIF